MNFKGVELYKIIGFFSRNDRYLLVKVVFQSQSNLVCHRYKSAEGIAEMTEVEETIAPLHLLDWVYSISASFDKSGSHTKFSKARKGKTPEKYLNYSRRGNEEVAQPKKD